MAINLSKFREIIFREVSASAPMPISIEKLYLAAERDLVFDQHDLKFTVSNHVSTNEPNWKRNLRNALQGLKDSGKLVNSSSGYWRLPSLMSKHKLDPNEAWLLIKDSAEKALKENVIWESVKQGHKYKVNKVEERKISIHRESKNTIEFLYDSDVIRSINSLNAAGGILGRRAMIYTVAKEVAIVNFHPQLDWDEDFENLGVIDAIKKPTHPEIIKFEEASDDDINNYQTYARRIRKGQSQLRLNLLEIYNYKCCISDTGPENVLQAAHIDPHSVTGSNISTNGLLLRSDLHDLFDDGLLLIKPETLTIKIHPRLINTYYYKYNNKNLATRIDGLMPNIEGLKRKWEQFHWDEKI